MNTVIIDYNAGNPNSIRNMLKKIGFSSLITNDLVAIKEANKIIIPGVGKFDYGVSQLKSLGIWEILNQKALHDKIPVLGICLGYQLMTKRSEEGLLPGFGWFDAETIRFPNNGELKIPNMGWRNISFSKESPLWDNFENDPRFYFVHSYYVKLNLRDDAAAMARYITSFDAAAARENIFGVQFHPEKSHRFGIQFLKNFMTI